MTSEERLLRIIADLAARREIEDNKNLLECIAYALAKAGYADRVDIL